MEYFNRLLSSGEVWTRPALDLGSYAGQTVQVAFHFFGTGPGVDVGWYLDEVMLATGPVQSLVANVPEGFESGLGDWSAERGVWEVGVPTSGPGGAYSGTNCLATVLRGNYPPAADTRAISPPILVPSNSENPRLRFWHWYSNDGTKDYGVVEVRPIGSNQWARLSGEFRLQGRVWSRPSFDLREFAGQTIQVAFHFIAEPGTDGAGWYLDEIELKSGPDIYRNPETFEFGWGDWDTDNFALWKLGAPASGPPLTNGVRGYFSTNVAATLLSGNYAPNSTGRLISPSFPVPSTTADGLVVARFQQWYGYGTGDGGRVQVSQWTGAGWSAWETLSVTATNGTLTRWTQAVVDLSRFTGQTIRLGFLHTANGDGSVGKGWMIDDLSVSDFIPSAITLGGTVTTTFATNDTRLYYVFDVPPGGHLRLTLNGAGANGLYLRRGALPTPGSYDVRLNSTATNRTVLVPDAGAGKWYALVLNDANPGAVSLQTEFVTGILLDSVSPNSLGNSIPGTLTINGAGFAPNSTVALLNGTTTNAATDLGVVSGGRIIADFDFSAVPPGAYTLQVSSGTNSATLRFTVTAGGTPKFESTIIVPRNIGYHALATLYVEYTNSGPVAMPAPILEVSGNQNGRRAAILTLDATRLTTGFWTDVMPDGFANSVQFLASGKTPGILQPGESGRVPVYYAGWQKPWDFGYPTIFFNVNIMAADTTNLVDWASLQDYTRPSDYTAEQWQPVFSSFVAQVGNTWGDYVRVIDGNARYLAKLGVNVSDTSKLFSFAILQASGFGVASTCGSAVDAQVAAPGLAITFTRNFGTDIPQHFRLGRFGRGWSDNWERSLVELNGKVTIFGSSGSRRIFLPDNRAKNAGKYFGQPGDIGTLAKIGATAFTLLEGDGTLSAFTNGNLDYIQDTHSNRITCAYSGTNLTRLTHSAGPWLQLTYTGSRVTSIRDYVGRETILAYDASGEHLISATDYRGLTTTYTYETTAGTSSQHALTSVTKPDATVQTLTYDVFGRLRSKVGAGCCGAGDSTTYTYGPSGRVTVTDALGNSTKFSHDYRGLLVKTENSLGSVITRAYDDVGRLIATTDAAGRQRSYEYDSRGNLIGDTDVLGHVTRFTYGALNKMASFTDAKGNPTHYAYANSDLLAITNAAGLPELWTYDAQGNRVSWQNRRGQVIGYTNDALGRLIARRYPDGTLHTFSYDARGHLTNYTDATGTTIQKFDAYDRMTNITYPAGYWLAYTYDNAGRRATMTDHLGHRTDYRYNANGRLDSLADETGTQIVLYTYDGVGRVSVKTLGNGCFTTYAYDVTGQITNLFNHKLDGSVLSRFEYTYDNRGRRVSMTTTYGAGDTRMAGLWRYDYDDTDQLVGWTAPNVRRVDYTYDSLGNRILVRDSGTNTAYSMNNLNQYTQAGSMVFQYDADGNLLTRHLNTGAMRRILCALRRSRP